MNGRLTLLHAKTSFAFLAFLFILLITLCGEASAGTGTFRRTGPNTGVFDFCVSVRFNATQAQLDRIKLGFDAASQVLADATDGHHRFGTVNIVNEGGAQEVAEFWIDLDNKRAMAPGPFYGDPRGRVTLHFLADFGGDSTNQAAILNSAYTIAHEFAHLTYDLRDEYPVTAAEIASGAECAAPPVPPKTFRDEPNLNYCLMDNFYTRGGWSAGLRTFTLNEFCVASNHDKPNANGVGANNTSQQRVHGKSCWQTIASLRKPWALPVPTPDLPIDAAPPYLPITFGTKCGNRYVLVLIDSSDSMFANINKIANAIEATDEYIESFKLGDYLAIASFADITKLGLPLTQITDAAARARAQQGLTDAIMFDRSGTNIGGSLLWARDYLAANASCPSSCEKTIILLTDGRHNVGLPPSFATERLVDAGIKLVIVNLGESIPEIAKLELQSVSTATAGRYYHVGFAPDGQGAFDSTDLITLFMELGKVSQGHGTVFRQRATISSNETKEFQIQLEPGAASAAFAITIDNKADNMALTLRTPSGATISGPSGTDIQFRSDGTRRVFQVNNPQAGTWKAVVTSGAVTAGRLEALAFVDHVGVNLLPTVDDNALSAQPVTITASPTYDSLRVVGASVTGTVTHPNGTQSSITLFDDGSSAHGDIAASDGVYSTLFSSYSVDGTYEVDLTSVNATGHTYAGEPLSEGAVATESPVPPFTRLGSVTFIVFGLDAGEVVWVDDALPQGAQMSGEWYWVEANPAPILGGASHQSKISELSPYTLDEHSFTNAVARLTLSPGDKLFAYVFLDPNASPQEIMLQWHADDGWEHRAYWGANYIQLGSDGTDGRRFLGELPEAGRWVRLEVPAASVGLEGKIINGMAFTTNGNRATWDRIGRLRGTSSPPTGDFVWVDDSRPAGSVEVNKDDVWDWVNIPGPYSGQFCHRSVLRGDTGTGRLRTHGFSRAQTPMKVEPGDVLYAYAYIDPNYRPDEIILQWEVNDNWEHRAYWGNNFVDLGVTGAESRRFMGALPPAAQWVRLEVPASYVGLEGKSITGMSFGYYKQNDRARVTWDLAGKSSQRQTVPYPLSSLTPLWRFRADSYGYSYSTNDIGRAEQSIQGIKAYVYPLQAAGTVPVYRFRDNDDGRYFYITRKVAPDPTWYYDGVAFYIYPQQVPGTVAMHQFYGRYSGSKEGYFYTTDTAEGASLGMSYQGILGYLNTANPLVPVAPSDVFGYEKGGIYWSDNSSNESGFKVERFFAESGGWTEIATVGPNVTSYSFLKACEERGRVRAYNAAGFSAYAYGGAGHLFVGADGKQRCIQAVPGQQPSPPSVTLVSPADGSTFKAGVNVQLKAEAFDAEGPGTIAKVEFFDGGFKIGESTRPPYMATLSGLTAGTHSLTATATDASGLSSTSAPLGITAQSVNAGDLLISELRFRGPGGQLDEFVELYNNTDFNLTVSTTDGSGGWSLVGSDWSVRCTIPNGTTIPARGHYLGANAAAYSLGAYAPADATWLGDIVDGGGVALFKTSSPANFTAFNRLDAVGFNFAADGTYREGVGLQPLAGVDANAEFSFFRRLSNGGTPQDTNDNGADFLFISTDGINSGGAQSVLGAPGPEGLNSPVQRNSSLGMTMLDPAVSSSTPPNRVRSFTSDPSNNSLFGTLAMRRTVTNNTGAPVTRLRFRVIDMTTYPVASGVADMRLRSSPAVQVSRSDGLVVQVQAMTLDTPPAQPNGGGFNSTVSVGSITLAEPLQPGASVHVQFLLGLQSTGSFRFYVNIEAWQ